MPPFNEEAEQAVLASMMHYEDMRDEIAIKISASDFHVPRHAVIYQACWELYRDKSPIEPRSLAEKLAGAKQLEAAGGARILLDEELTPENLSRLVKELLASPDALRAMGQAQRSLDRPDALDTIVDEMLRLSEGRKA